MFLNIPHIFAEVEVQRNEEIDLSLLISSDTGENSVVLDHSQDLGENIRKGQRLKDVTGEFEVLAVDYDYTRKVCENIITSLDRFSPDVISDSFGQFYLDMTGTQKVFGSTLDTGLKIIKFLQCEFNISCSVGIGTNKLIAYLSGVVSKINSALEISPEEEMQFLYPLSTFLLPDVSEDLLKQENYEFNLKTVGKISKLSEEDIYNLFGEDGKILYEYSNNIAPTRLVLKKRKKTIQGKKIITENSNEIVRQKFFKLVLDMCVNLRQENIYPKNWELFLKYDDEYKVANAKKFKSPCYFEYVIYSELLPFIEKALKRRVSIKIIEIVFSNFFTPTYQLGFFQDMERDFRLANAFDRIRKRFGNNALRYAKVR